jgi:hypothetical protein
MFSFFSKPAWDDPDWRVRQKTALTKKDAVQLRRLALTDVAEEVRVAAVKGLDDQDALVEVVRRGACNASRQLAASRVTDPARRIALVQEYGVPDECRLLALKGLPADPRLLSAYRPDSGETFKHALLDLLGGVRDEAFWARVAKEDPERKVRARAIEQIASEKIRASLARSESDPALRRKLAEGIKSGELLQQLFDDEDQESARIWLAGRIQEPAILGRIAREDHNADVRIAAINRLASVPVLCEIASGSGPIPACLAALARLPDDHSRGVVAMRSPHEDVRAEALRTITDEEVLSKLEDEASQPEIRWLAGRRIGSMPMDALSEIRNGRTLRRLIELETEPEVATWLVGRVGDQETLRVLGGSTFPGVAAALRRLGERVGPLGMRFMPVPGRPYEMGLFPVTVGQLREALGSAVVPGKGGDELPAVGVTPEVARQFCDYMSKHGKAQYRLPSFEEWRHACMANDENWLDVASGQFSWAEALVGTQRLAVGCNGRRAALVAWANPWGFLDMVGNVAVWVDDSPRHWLHLASGDPLAVGGDPGKETDFALAAGASWADARVRKGRLERLVARSILNGWGADKVGFRVLCEQEKAVGSAARYKLVLLPETAQGVSKQDVIAAMGTRWVEATNRIDTWYRVAPAVVLLTPQYNEVRRVKRMLEECGARTQLTTG